MFQLGQGVIPRFFLGQRHGGDGIGDVLDERAGHVPAMILLQVEEHST
jgi:hypothetical protein